MTDGFQPKKYRVLSLRNVLRNSICQVSQRIISLPIWSVLMERCIDLCLLVTIFVLQVTAGHHCCCVEVAVCAADAGGNV